MTQRNKKNIPIALTAKEGRARLKKTGNARCKVTDAELKEALEHTEGETAAARVYLREFLHTDVAIRTINERIAISDALQKIKEDADTETTSIASYNVKKRVKKGDYKASTWWLSHSKQGKAQGFGAKIENEISNPDGGIFRVAPFDIEGKSREEIMQMVKEAHGRDER